MMPPLNDLCDLSHLNHVFSLTRAPSGLAMNAAGPPEPNHGPSDPKADNVRELQNSSALGRCRQVTRQGIEPAGEPRRRPVGF